MACGDKCEFATRFGIRDREGFRMTEWEGVAPVWLAESEGWGDVVRVAGGDKKAVDEQCKDSGKRTVDERI